VLITVLNFTPGGLLPLATAFATPPSRWFDEYGVGAAILLTLVGTALQLYLPRHRMAAEEAIKDGKLTHEEARRQFRFYQWIATIATVSSVLILLFVLLDLAD